MSPLVRYDSVVVILSPLLSRERGQRVKIRWWNWYCATVWWLYVARYFVYSIWLANKENVKIALREWYFFYRCLYGDGSENAAIIAQSRVSLIEAKQIFSKRKCEKKNIIKTSQVHLAKDRTLNPVQTYCVAFFVAVLSVKKNNLPRWGVMYANQLRTFSYLCWMLDYYYTNRQHNKVSTHFVFPAEDNTALSFFSSKEPLQQRIMWENIAEGLSILHVS